MLVSPLAETFRCRGAELAEYAGCLTWKGDPEALALQPWPLGQVLLYDAGWRAPLLVQGPEARKWLNGMITANVRDLAPGRIAPSFQLDPKGHILATLDVVCLEPDAFLLVTDESQRPGLEARLRRFVFISKLAIEDRGQLWSGLWLRGPAWPETWREAALPPLALEPGAAAAFEIEGETAWAVSTAPGGIAQLEILAPAPLLPGLWSRLETVATPAGSAMIERDRILHRTPRYGVDIADTDLPQETGQLDRLDFTKGCYIGQEIVERIRARGAVHRHWTGFAWEASVPPGTTVEAGDRAAGLLTSVTSRGEGWFGLGYIRDPHHAAGVAVSAAGVRGQVEP